MSADVRKGDSGNAEEAWDGLGMLSAGAPIFERDHTTYLGGRMILSSGEAVFDQPRRVDAPLKQGLTVALTLSGALTYRIDDRPPVVVRTPSVSLIVAAAAHRREQVFEAANRICYLMVHLDPSLIEETFGMDFADLVAATEAVAGMPNPNFLSRTPDRAVRGVASKLMTSPIEGFARPVYRMGKAFELVAAALEQHMPGVTRPRPARSIAEAEQIRAARAILIEEYSSPPSLAALAARVGLNERKLNTGFRQLFGLTVYAFILEHRLQRAHQMLASGEISVSEVAYRVGYGPAHFATVFRKRFGFSPRELR
ncbi:helix-turn-helix transcriptional regulator [Azorhizobium doebereinerae]|uniref:helix-turn-helix transcriptional regulator n=1 Tax=Azorhizobium doebereinerae TaxID=281091 RepID=UPI00048B55FC|nr:AraC family transcriptional regulator [Azorhizobium doebereinerae]